MAGALSKNWDSMEDFCKMTHGQGSIWYATLIEVTDYIAAARALDVTGDGATVSNRSALSVWIEKDGVSVEISAGETVQFD